MDSERDEADVSKEREPKVRGFLARSEASAVYVEAADGSLKECDREDEHERGRHPRRRLREEAEDEIKPDENLGVWEGVRRKRHEPFREGKLVRAYGGGEGSGVEYLRDSSRYEDSAEDEAGDEDSVRVREETTQSTQSIVRSGIPGFGLWLGL